MIRYLISIILFSFGILYPQTIDDLYKKIEDKIKEDNTYLNLYSVEFNPVKASDVQGLENIPTSYGGKVNFEVNIGLNLKYLFIVMPKNIDFDSTTILLVKKETTPQLFGGNVLNGANGQNGGSEQGGPKEDIFLSFKDVQNLYYNYPAIYKYIWNIVDSLMNISKPEKLLKIKVDQEIKKSKGISAKDNLDFLNFNLVNNSYYYPKIRKNTIFANSLSGRFDNNNQSGGMHISASLSRVTFFYDNYMQWDYNIVTAGLTTESELLNIPPFAGMVLSPEFRTLVFLGEKGDLQNNFILDAKLSGRIRVNTKNLAATLPVMLTDSPRLNIVSGGDIKLSFTRPMGLPFLNLYYSTSFEDLNSPYVKFDEGDSSIAYFNFQRFYATMSFYWNSSESRNLRFRLDVGFGRHNIIEAVYHKNYTERILAFNKINPLLELYLTFVPGGNDLTGTSIRYYDSIMKINFWLQLVKISEHEFRITVLHISQPFFRGVRPWENNSSTLFGINYRYGF